jgi:hypothetical protein
VVARLGRILATQGERHESTKGGLSVDPWESQILIWGVVTLTWLPYEFEVLIRSAGFIYVKADPDAVLPGPSLLPLPAQAHAACAAGGNRL